MVVRGEKTRLLFSSLVATNPWLLTGPTLGVRRLRTPTTEAPEGMFSLLEVIEGYTAAILGT